MGEGCRSDATHSSTVLFDAEGIDETSARVGEQCGAATDGENEGGRSVQERVDVIGCETRAPPSIIVGVVAIQG